MILRFAKLDPDAKAPVRKHVTDAGIDVFAREGHYIEGHAIASSIKSWLSSKVIPVRTLAMACPSM